MLYRAHVNGSHPKGSRAFAVMTDRETLIACWRRTIVQWNMACDSIDDEHGIESRAAIDMRDTRRQALGAWDEGLAAHLIGDIATAREAIGRAKSLAQSAGDCAPEREALSILTMTEKAS